MTATAVAERAAAALARGQAAIVDAVYARPADRQAIERTAAGASVPFAGFWLEAAEPTLVARTAQRRNDASDADADVVRMQAAQQTGEVLQAQTLGDTPAAIDRLPIHVESSSIIAVTSVCLPRATSKNMARALW